MRSIAVALIAAGLAVLLVAAVALARNDERPNYAPVLVAAEFIPAGTPAEVVFDTDLGLVENGQPDEPPVYQPIADPSYLAGRVTTRDIEPGQQILFSYFSHTR